MSINEPCFKKLYESCCDIIKNSNDKNIKNKQTKLNDSYNKLIRTQDCELQEFYSIVLELRVYEYLLKNKINIKATNDTKKGPDFECDFGYLECVSVTKGEKGTPGRDFIDKQLLGSVNRHKSELPRISSAIKDKKDKYTNYIENKVINDHKPLIIVVGTSIFANEFNSSSCIEDTMQVLYSIGNEYLMYDVKNRKFIDTPNRQNRNYDNYGKKSESLNLEFDYFFKNDYKNISAVILVCNHIFENIDKNNFRIFLNPYTSRPIDKNAISLFKYFNLIKENDNGFAVYEWHK